MAMAMALSPENAAHKRANHAFVRIIRPDSPARHPLVIAAPGAANGPDAAKRATRQHGELA
jgi:hypothetical protein